MCVSVCVCEGEREREDRVKVRVHVQSERSTFSTRKLATLSLSPLSCMLFLEVFSLPHPHLLSVPCIYLVRSGTGNGLSCCVLVWCGWWVGGWVSLSVECFSMFDVVIFVHRNWKALQTTSREKTEVHWGRVYKHIHIGKDCWPALEFRL